ncbi:MAG TPA: DUF2917 domain-containing protein [Burkholderiaceae bacterium]|nr:DUF2917 domain-containing protein [Burkholderiaceae bacterium]
MARTAPDAGFQMDLPARTVLTLPDAAGIGIECRSGTLWVTLDHDPRDIVLERGQRYVGDVHRRALVSALGPSSIAVTHARPAAWPPGGADAAVAPRSPGRLVPHGLSPA